MSAFYEHIQQAMADALAKGEYANEFDTVNIPLAARKISAYMQIPNELVFPELYELPPLPKPPWLKRVKPWLRGRWYYGRRAVGFWIAGENPDDHECY